MPMSMNMGMIVKVNVEVWSKEIDAREFETKSGPCSSSNPTIPELASANQTGILHAKSPRSRKTTKKTIAVVVIDQFFSSGYVMRLTVLPCDPPRSQTAVPAEWQYLQLRGYLQPGWVLCGIKESHYLPQPQEMSQNR